MAAMLGKLKISILLAGLVAFGLNVEASFRAPVRVPLQAVENSEGLLRLQAELLEGLRRFHSLEGNKPSETELLLQVGCILEHDVDVNSSKEVWLRPCGIAEDSRAIELLRFPDPSDEGSATISRPRVGGWGSGSSRGKD